MAQKPPTNSVIGIPAVPKDASPSVQAYLRALAEAVEVNIGIRGDPENRTPTVKELADAGILERTEFSAKFNPNDINDQNRGYRSRKAPSKAATGGAGTEVKASPLVKVFTSKRQVVADGESVTVPHSLGRVPDLIQPSLYCVKSDGTFFEGDIVVIGPLTDLNLSAFHVGCTIQKTATDVTVTIATRGVGLFNTETSAQQGFSGAFLPSTNNGWELEIKAFVFD